MGEYAKIYSENKFSINKAISELEDILKKV